MIPIIKLRPHHDSVGFRDSEAFGIFRKFPFKAIWLYSSTPRRIQILLGSTDGIRKVVLVFSASWGRLFEVWWTSACVSGSQMNSSLA